MKKILVISVASAMLCFTACSQAGKDVPRDVKTAFSRKFPDATGVKWDMENDREWEAEFKLNGREYSANFDQAGTWKETEYEVAESGIPSSVRETLDHEFADSEIEKSEISETPEGKIYEFELKTGKGKSDVSIDTSGKVLKKEPEKKKDKDTFQGLKPCNAP